MKLRLRTDYAIKIVKTISEMPYAVVTSKVISEKQKIPHGVLMKVMKELKLHEIVESHQGRGEVVGGYSLKRPITKITLLEIIEVMEGPIMLEQIIKENNSQTVTGMNKEYERINEILKIELGRYTLKDIFEQETSVF